MTTPQTWRIYRGGGAEPHDGIDHLPPPPPWRRFDGPVTEDTAPSHWHDPRPGVLDRARSYLPDDEIVQMTNAALYLRRPLLVTGKPGTGKSTLAYSVAHELKLGRVLYWPITSRSQLHDDALYRYDAIGRLQQARIDSDPSTGDGSGLDIGRFIRLGPFGTALLPQTRPRVLLIDELDKSDIDLPNDLLNIMEEGEYEITELTRAGGDAPTRVFTDDPGRTVDVPGGVIRCREFPLVIITSNGEREFPPAFLRRCLQLTIQPPNLDKLAQIVAAQLGHNVLDSERDLIDRFIDARDNADLATDQLLNAFYLVTSSVKPDPMERQHLLRELFKGIGSA